MLYIFPFQKESFVKVKERIQKKLEVPDKEFERVSTPFCKGNKIYSDSINYFKFFFLFKHI